MRLLNTKTIELVEFFSGNIPDYAILSHRWEEEEVTFRHFQNGDQTKQSGYRKIEGCCRQAEEDGWEYAWVDSCCIDKSSSSELSEAINSMFKWYQDAQVCYAYLSDVPSLATLAGHYKKPSAFRVSKWFTRGWTLQELLAPDMMIFFDQTWKEIDTKLRLKDLLSEITGIRNLLDYKLASVAQKFSWASKRRTTRIEDEAYCLMGLFRVNMPLLYGEGQNAFLRLQLEIIKISDDESIFAWTEAHRIQTTGLLAKSTTAFSNSSGIIFSERVYRDRAPYSMTSKGLEIQMWLKPISGPQITSLVLRLRRKVQSGDTPLREFIAPLRCQELSTGNYVSLRLIQLSKSPPKFERLHSGRPGQPRLFFDPEPHKMREEDKQTIYVPQHDFSLENRRIQTLIKMNIQSPKSHGFEMYHRGEFETIGFGPLGKESSRKVIYFRHSRPASEIKDRFAIILENRDESCLRMGLLLPQESEPWDSAHWEDAYSVACELDRVSMVLNSNRSVSAILTKNGRGQGKWGHQSYQLEVRIHPDGALPWSAYVQEETSDKDDLESYQYANERIYRQPSPSQSSQ